MAYNIFERWPFTSFQNLNLDWVLKTVKEAANRASEAAQTVAGYASRLLDLEVLVQNHQAHIGTLENDVESLTEDVHSNTAYIREVDGVANSANDKADSLDAEAVKTSVQDLDANKKLQARVNISAGSTSVVYDDEMEALIITDEITGELETVPVGGGGGGSADAVLYTSQNLTTSQKRQARQNIGAGESTVSYNENTGVLSITDADAGVPTAYHVPSDTVRYGAAQTLTEAQKAQARANIGFDSDIIRIYMDTNDSKVKYVSDGTEITSSVIKQSTEAGKIVRLENSSGTEIYTLQGFFAPLGVSVFAIFDSDTAAVVVAGSHYEKKSHIDISYVTAPNSSNPNTFLKYLGDVDGEPNYDWAPLPNGIFIVTATVGSQPGLYTFDKSAAEILAAVQSGKLPVVRYHTTAGQSDYHVYYEWVFDYYTYDGEDVYIYFSRVDQYGNSAQLRWYGSTGKAAEVSRPTLPPATSADNGKIPQVNSFGDYQLVTIPAAENSSFGGA